MKLVSWSELLTMARVTEKQGNFSRAVFLYTQARRLAPTRLEPATGLMRTLLQLGRLSEAALVHDSLANGMIYEESALAEIFSIQMRLGRLEDALATVEEIHRSSFNAGALLSQLASGAAHCCEWPVRDRAVELLWSYANKLSPFVADMLSLFSFTDDTDLHQKFAGMIATKIRSKHPASSMWISSNGPRRKSPSKSSRLRIAYLGGQFSHHAVTLLLTGVIEQHNRNKFDVMLFDYSNEDGSETRARILRAFDYVELLGKDGPKASADRIAQLKPDILIDTQGYIAGTRSEILAYRPAAVQINFLGYVGSQAADWCDYTIADKTVLPDSERSRWREAVIYMPNSCYPNDRSRPTPKTATKIGRAAHALPENAFVFCCFNNLFKLTRETFTLWMSILRDCPNSVLWLRNTNAQACENLRRYAIQSQVSPARLVFAESTGLSQHIDRHEYAHLCLDTHPYGSHTMGCDALWAGLPIVTMVGRSFASRVAASLLHAVGLPQLVADSAEQYKEKCQFYYGNPNELAPLRAQLCRARNESTLFDATLYSQQLENAFEQILHRSPRDICPV